METVTDYELKMKEAFMTKPISYFMALSSNSIEQEVSNLHKRLKMEQIENLTRDRIRKIQDAGRSRRRAGDGPANAGTADRRALQAVVPSYPEACRGQEVLW